MKKKVLIGFSIIVLLGIAGILSFNIYLEQKYPRGMENSKICDQIKAGISLSELYNIIGKPYSEFKDNEATWVLFQTNPIAAGAIRAKINKDKNEVLALKCWEDVEPNWDISRQ